MYVISASIKLAKRSICSKVTNIGTTSPLGKAKRICIPVREATATVIVSSGYLSIPSNIIAYAASFVNRRQHMKKRADGNLEDLLKIGAAYIRVSDERQDEYSPDSQLKKVREFAAKQGYQVPDEYVFYDDGISGRSVRRRDDFNRMIATAKDKSHPFEVIYVWKFSRFCRNQEESMVYKNLLRKIGISVVSVSETVPEGPFGSLVERIIEWMDEFYSINLGAEVQRGMTEKASRGEPVVPPPFGYIMKDGEYLPDEERAPIVKEIFERYANGEKQRAIALSLGTRGILTRKGKKFDNRYIDYILINSTYIGKIRYSLDGTQAIHRRDYTNEKIMEVDGKHPPIIPFDLWEKVQKLHKEQKQKYPKYARKDQPIEFMLKGLVRCSACGGPIVMSQATSGKTKTPTLQCCNYVHAKCHTSHSVVITKLEDALIDGLEQAVATRDFKLSPQKQKKSPSTDAIDFDKLIAVEQRKIARAKEAYLAEIDTLEDYKRHKSEAESRIKDLEAKRDLATPGTVTLNEKAFSRKVSKIISLIKRPSVSPAAKNEALRTIVEKIIYHKDQAKISIFFHDIK